MIMVVTLTLQVFIEQNPTAAIFYSGSLFKEFKSLAQEVFAILDFLPENRAWDSSLDSLKGGLNCMQCQERTLCTPHHHAPPARCN